MAMLPGLHPAVRERVQAALETAQDEGIRVTITSTLRDSRKQAALYKAWLDRGRTGLPAAPPGRSTHEFGYGVDAVVAPASALPRFVAIMECMGMIWAGRADPVHWDPFGFDQWSRALAGQAVDVHYRC